MSGWRSNTGSPRGPAPHDCAPNADVRRRVYVPIQSEFQRNPSPYPASVPRPTNVPGCAEARAALPRISEREAARLLEPIIEEARARYAAIGADKLRRTRVEVSEHEGSDGRHFGACSEDGELILLSPDLALLPLPTSRGIIFHEFGHAADFSYPARWVQTAQGVRLIPPPENPYMWQQGRRRQDGSFGPSSVRLRRGELAPRPEHMDPITREMLSDWRRRNAHVVELAADQIAEAALGERIGYGGPCMLQTVGEGVARPRGLRLLYVPAHQAVHRERNHFRFGVAHKHLLQSLPHRPVRRDGRGDLDVRLANPCPLVHIRRLIGSRRIEAMPAKKRRSVPFTRFRHTVVQFEQSIALVSLLVRRLAELLFGRATRREMLVGMRMIDPTAKPERVLVTGLERVRGADHERGVARVPLLNAASENVSLGACRAHDGPGVSEQVRNGLDDPLRSVAPGEALERVLHDAELPLPLRPVRLQVWTQDRYSSVHRGLLERFREERRLEVRADEADQAQHALVRPPCSHRLVRELHEPP